jgi:hypothetical protein
MAARGVEQVVRELAVAFEKSEQEIRDVLVRHDGDVEAATEHLLTYVSVDELNSLMKKTEAELGATQPDGTTTEQQSERQTLLQNFAHHNKPHHTRVSLAQIENKKMLSPKARAETFAAVAWLTSDAVAVLAKAGLHAQGGMDPQQQTEIKVCCVACGWSGVASAASPDPRLEHNLASPNCALSDRASPLPRRFEKVPSTELTLSSLEDLLRSQDSIPAANTDSDSDGDAAPAPAAPLRASEPGTSTTVSGQFQSHVIVLPIVGSVHDAFVAVGAGVAQFLNREQLRKEDVISVSTCCAQDTVVATIIYSATDKVESLAEIASQASSATFESDNNRQRDDEGFGASDEDYFSM